MCTKLVTPWDIGDNQDDPFCEVAVVAVVAAAVDDEEDEEDEEEDGCATPFALSM